MTASKRRFLWRSAALLTALAAATLGAVGRAADDAPKAAKSELDLIPSDGAAVVSFRVGELWNDPAFKAARDKVMKDDPHFIEGFAKEVGVEPDEIERVTGVMLSMESEGNWLVFVTTAKPYDSKKVLAAAPDAAEEKVKDRTFANNPKGRSFALLTDRTYAVGSTEEVKRYLNHARGVKEGPLTPACGRRGSIASPPASTSP